MHDARLGFGAGAFVGFRDVKRYPHIDLAASGMAGGAVRRTIALDRRCHIGEGAARHYEDRVAEPADRREGVGAAGRHPDRRQRLLSGFWRDRDIVEAVVLALERKARLRPGTFDDLQGLGKAVAAFGVGYAISLVGAGQPAAPDAENQPTVADLVDRR